MIINNKKYTPVINFNTMRLFMKATGIKKLSEFDKVMGDKSEDELTIDDIENRATLLLSAIREGCRQSGEKCDLTVDDVFAAFSDDGGIMDEFMKEFTESMPDAEGDNKKKADQAMK